MRARTMATLAMLSACALGGVMLAATGVAQASATYVFSDEYGAMWWSPSADLFYASTTNETPLTGNLGDLGGEWSIWKLPNGKCMTFNNDGLDGGDLKNLQDGYVDEATCPTGSTVPPSMYWWGQENSNGTESFENEYVADNYSPGCYDDYDWAYLGASDGANSRLSMNCPDKAGDPSAGEEWSS